MQEWMLRWQSAALPSPLARMAAAVLVGSTMELANGLCDENFRAGATAPTVENMHHRNW